MSARFSAESPDRVKHPAAHGAQACFFHSHKSGPSAPFLQLQRTLGNRRVGQLIQAKRLTPEGRIIGGGMIGLQPKLTVGAADDQYEQEADRVARQVMGMADTASASPVQRAGVPEETPEAPEDKDKLLQASPLTSRGAAITPLASNPQSHPQRQAEEGEPEKEVVQRSSLANTANAAGGMQRRVEMDEDQAESIHAKSDAALAQSFEAGEEVEAQLTLPIENALSGLPHAIRVLSHTQFGLSSTVITCRSWFGTPSRSRTKLISLKYV